MLNYHGSVNERGVVIQFNFPRFVRVCIMKLKGLCAREHSQFKGYYCIHKKKHAGMCGCC